ncbi:hypothetical protein WJX72_010762 [[Myrmecia] bisecta]|uniref:Uncharacterized protein n=1 Tax=[Myrmecia] bisecta TaxID=41462 RepID=A0AAW1Q0Q8_9CHLO
MVSTRLTLKRSGNHCWVTKAATSPIEGILDRERYSLEELLEEDDLIQECKSLNGRLVEFLQRKGNVQALINYLVVAPTPTADAKRQFKYPYAACEVLCCEVDSIFTTLVEDPSLMQALFAILDGPKPLDCMLAGYFSRVVASLLMRRGKEVLAWLQGQPQILPKLVEHLDTTSVAETLVRLVGADEQTSTFLTAPSLQWLTETDIMQQLLSRLDTDQTFDMRENAAEVLAAIARSRASPLTQTLGGPNFLQQLVERAFSAEQNNTLVQALNICIALLERRRHLEGTMMRNSGDQPPQTTELDSKLEADAVLGIAQHTPRLATLLATHESNPTQETPFGVLKPPLGTARLTVIALVAVLLRTGSQVAEEAVIQSGVMLKCLQLFLRFPFNSILHHQITSIVTVAMDSGTDAIVRHMFIDCDLLTWISSVPADVKPEPRPGDARGPTRAPLRAGYNGHVTTIANKLVATASKRELVAGFLNSHAGWQAYLRDVLRIRNEIENVRNWACGRPSSSSLRAVDSDSDDMFHDELNLEAISDSFGKEASTRYSAFSDDDDEDDDELNKSGAIKLPDDTEEVELNLGALKINNTGRVSPKSPEHYPVPDSWDVPDAGEDEQSWASLSGAASSAAPGSSAAGPNSHALNLQTSFEEMWGRGTGAGAGPNSFATSSQATQPFDQEPDLKASPLTKGHDSAALSAGPAATSALPPIRTAPPGSGSGATPAAVGLDTEDEGPPMEPPAAEKAVYPGVDDEPVVLISPITATTNASIAATNNSIIPGSPRSPPGADQGPRAPASNSSSSGGGGSRESSPARSAHHDAPKAGGHHMHHRNIKVLSNVRNGVLRDDTDATLTESAGEGPEPSHRKGSKSSRRRQGGASHHNLSGGTISRTPSRESSSDDGGSLSSAEEGALLDDDLVLVSSEDAEPTFGLESPFSHAAAQSGPSSEDAGAQATPTAAAEQAEYDPVSYWKASWQPKLDLE